MFCPQCGTEIVASARYCMKCGQEIPTNETGPVGPVVSNNESDPKFTQPAILGKVRWYESRRNAIGIAVLSFFLYSYVLITTLAGKTLRGNEAVYIALWTGIVFYVIWKRRAWRGWLGALVGFVSGFAVVFIAAEASGLNR